MKKPDKAYKNVDFLNSREARIIRILSEYLEPEKRFREHNIEHTVVIFGSARIRPEGDFYPGIGRYYKAAEETAFKLAEWSKELGTGDKTFSLCCGGGPGIMEAANRGAYKAGVKSIALNISLASGQVPNKYITPELGFEFHYFFMRKLWFTYHAKAFVFFPGGFGTLDELFECLTLAQTGKMVKPDLQVLLYDKSFWDKTINFNLLEDMGLISDKDKRFIKYFETPDEGLAILKPHLEQVIKNFNLH
jgi:uncharacterized protein (TIGR00730 family)